MSKIVTPTEKQTVKEQSTQNCNTPANKNICLKNSDIFFEPEAQKNSQVLIVMSKCKIASKEKLESLEAEAQKD